MSHEAVSHEVTKTEATKLTKNTKIPIQETKPS